MSWSIIKRRRLFYFTITKPNMYYSTKSKIKSLTLNEELFTTDEYTNITPHIISFLNKNMYLRPNNPVSLVRQRIVNYFNSLFTQRKERTFSVYENLSPVVSSKQNFEELYIPEDHPSRAKSVNYYINKSTLLRGHMTAHQSELLRSGLDNFLMIGDVYRPSEINSSHYPILHQVDAVKSQNKQQLFENQSGLNIFEPGYDQVNPHNYKNSLSDPAKQSCYTLEATRTVETQLKEHLIDLVRTLFDKNVDHRWADAFIPFTHPSWKLEIYWDDHWKEVLHCGIIRHEILVNAGQNNNIAYAFGLGLERLAMAIYKIPDIRAMWRIDTGFTNQFKTDDINAKITYKPVSVHSRSFREMSFWLPPSVTIDTFLKNDFYDLVRHVAGDIVEQVELKDKFIHPETNKHSLTFKLCYRHSQPTLKRTEVQEIHKKIEKATKNAFNVDIR